MRWILLASRVVIGGLFLFAAATKVPDLHAFAGDVANYRLLPAPFVPYAAAMVVGVEIVVGLALVTGIAARAGAVIASALLIAFIGFLSNALVHGIDLRCGCFGGDETATWGTVGRDVLMLVPAVLVAFRLPRKEPQRDVVASR